MTYDNFTIKAQEAILKSQKIASELEQQQVDTPHLIKGIILNDEQMGEFLFKKMDISIEKLNRKLNNSIKILSTGTRHGQTISFGCR